MCRQTPAIFTVAAAGAVADICYVLESPDSVDVGIYIGDDTSDFDAVNACNESNNLKRKRSSNDNSDDARKWLLVHRVEFGGSLHNVAMGYVEVRRSFHPINILPHAVIAMDNTIRAAYERIPPSTITHTLDTTDDRVLYA
jgi:hypothetical protein